MDTYDVFKEVVNEGMWARVWWNENEELERQVQEETQATHRCYPLDQPGSRGKCFLTGEEADQVALFARAY